MRPNSRARRWLPLAGIVVAAVAGDASAIVGRPLTPVSVAGVARRSVRRSAYVAPAAAVGTAAAVGAAAGTAATLRALPPGCAVGMPCGGVVYHPAYYGTTVVYTPY